MAGKNSRFNKFLQTIGIVDEPEEEFTGSREYAGGSREYSSGRDGYYGREPESGYRGGRESAGRDNRYEAPFGYGERDYGGAPSSRYSQPRQQPRQQPRSPQEGYPPRGNVTPMPPRGNYAPDSFAPRASARSRYEAPGPAGLHADARQRTVIYAIRTLEECQDVIIDLIEGKTTLVNLEDLRSEFQQRALDTLAGASFALNAVLRKASDKIYLIAPAGVEINDMGMIERRY